jgi:hypothetical protein
MELVSMVENAVSHDREVGRFMVVYKSNIKVFKTLVSAFIFYDKLDKEATLWDITESEELLEQKCYQLTL